ncbi:MAG: orotidine-5'-phosphate decarboxylase [Candidatus Omnitrophota bacterium]
MSRKPELIIALDVDNLKKAKRLVDILYPTVKIFKVGSQLFTAAGAQAVSMIKKKGAKVFLDLKFYDIPNTVANAVSAAVALRVFMLDVHIAGEAQMLKAAVQAAKKQSRHLKIKPPLIVGITVLTSQKSGKKVRQLVLSRARLAKKCGLDGVVASAQEARLLRKNLGRNFSIITPGIRIKQRDCSDQKRITSPCQAVIAGSDYLVVGRPVIKAKNPLAAAKSMLAEICQVKT